MKGIIYSDVEKIYVAWFKNVFQDFQDKIFIGTQKQITTLTDGVNKPIQIIIRDDGGVSRDKVFKDNDITINLWVAGDSISEQYIQANKLSQALGVILKESWQCLEDVAYVENISVVPIIYNGSEELREITATITIKGKYEEIDLGLS